MSDDRLRRHAKQEKEFAIMPFDLCLSYPQWQGSGRHEHLPRGAAAAIRA